MGLKGALVDLATAAMPKSWVLPAKFHYHRLRGDLEAELAALDTLIGRGGTAIDIGANFGLYSFVLSRLCDRVEAFEPQPACAAALRAYGAANIRVHQVALSREDGTLELKIPVSSGRALGGFATLREVEGECLRYQVPVRRLDDFQFEDVRFVKVDVEGHELQVLAGAQETLRRHKPVLVIEVEQRHLGERPMSAVFESILSLGYQGAFMAGGRLRPLSEFSYETHQRPYLDAVERDTACRDYIHNFVFRPGGAA